MGNTHKVFSQCILEVFTPNPCLIHKVNYEYVLGRNPLIFKAVLRKDEFCDE